MIVDNWPRLLLAEDDNDLRDVLIAHLSIKFEVLSAATAADAINVFHFTEPIQLLITDLDLEGPGFGGLLASHIRTKAPHLPIILISGHSKEIAHVQAFLQLSYTAFLKKPFALEQLDAMIIALMQKP